MTVNSASTKKKDPYDSGLFHPPCWNYLNGSLVEPAKDAQMIDVICPSTNEKLCEVVQSTETDVNAAVAAASAAFESWSSQTHKTRCSVMQKLHALIEDKKDLIADLIVLENGKNQTEALADVSKGLETVQYATSLQSLAEVKGRSLPVSRGVQCEDRVVPLGVVACVVPFNFPLMVPMWTVPIALALGNCVILKPSEKVPMTMRFVAKLFTDAGVPEGVFATVNGGGGDLVNAIIDHEDIQAVTFVGSTPIARIVANRCKGINKRCLALGGAKNHLIALKDCDINGTVRDVVTSSFGCAGQRCMASSAFVVIGEQPELMAKLKEEVGKIKLGVSQGEMGPVITPESLKNIRSYLDEVENAPGASLLVDGRGVTAPKNYSRGNWIGPSVILHTNKNDCALTNEIFGPVLSVIQVDTWQEAIDIENNNPFGNAACVYTTRGAAADWFLQRFRAAMLGVNVGIPVPREPFAFGGLAGTDSKFGSFCDITSEGAIEFFTNKIKVTTRWPQPEELSKGSEIGNNSQTGSKKRKAEFTDLGNFNGKM